MANAEERRRRIAIVLPDLALIGAQRYVLGIAKMLSSRGFAVEYLLLNASGEFLKEAPADKISSYDSRIFPTVRFVRNLESLTRLSWGLISGNYDFVLSVTPFLNRIVSALRMLRVIDSRVIIEEHGYPPLYLTEADGMQAWLVRLLKRTFWTYRYADSIRVISSGIKDYYSEELGLGDRAIYYPNLIDLDRVDRLGRETPSAQFGTKGKNIVYFGRLSKQKNVSYLIECFAELNKDIGSHLWILGDGDQKTALMQLARSLGLGEKVTFLGFLENPYAVLKQGDVFALTSIWEGLPQVIVEAMQLRVPVVAVDCKTGPRDMIGAGSERGWLVPENDRRAFVDALREALADEPVAKERAAKATEFVRDNYELRTCFDGYVEAFFN